MNDRYLFRAKRKDNGEWIIGSLIQTPYLYGVKSWISSEEEDKTRLRAISTYQAVWRAFEVRTDTICQCTGLKDKNGKLIWENDIVKHYNNIDYPETYDIGIVYWDNYQSGFERTSRTAKEYVYINGSCIYEVIGNVFDNPELLENNEED